MPRDEAALLLDMLESARDAVSFAEGLEYADFVKDRRSQLAILKAVEIVGEAAYGAVSACWLNVRGTC